MFKPGVSGNPKGRPKKGTALTDILNAKVNAEKLAEMLIEKAGEGDVVAMKYIYDRIDGKPKETVDIDHSGDMGIDITVDYVKPKKSKN